MSNHSGSYMLNDALSLLEKAGVFEAIGLVKSQQLVIDIVEMSREYDCNPGEILEGYGDKLKICYYCLRPAEHLEKQICDRCRKQYGV